MKPHLTPQQLEEFGNEMDALRQRVLADLGEDDAAYIREVVRRQRREQAVAGEKTTKEPHEAAWDETWASRRQGREHAQRPAACARDH